MGSKQKVRAQQFKDDPTVGALSFAQGFGADALLAVALGERQRIVYRYAHDHASFAAPGAIVLAVTALDVWLAETISFVNIGTPKMIDATLPTLAKYEALCALLGIVPPAALRAELEMAVELRNELVHYLPRRFGADPVPAWFMSLEARGLFFGAGEADRWQFCQRLCGYRLAYWTFRTVEAAALFVRDHAPPTHAAYVALAHNFTLYRRATPPEELPRYDAGFGLSLTTPHVHVPQ